MRAMSYCNSTAAVPPLADVAAANTTQTTVLPAPAELPEDVLERARIYALDLGVALPEPDLVHVLTLPIDRIREVVRPRS